MIDIFTPEILTKAVSVLPSSATFFRDTFFKTRNCNPTTKVRGEFYKGKRRVAPYVSEKITAGVTKKIGYVTEDYITPLVKVKDTTNIEDILKKGFGENPYSPVTPQERAYKELLKTLKDFNEQITRREEISCAQALLDGKVIVKGEGVDYEIDFGFTNKLVLSELWDEENASVDPLCTLSEMKIMCIKNGYRNPDICVMERSAYNSFITRCKALGYLEDRHFLNLLISPKVNDEHLTYCGHIADPDLDIYVYDEWYIDDWSEDVPVEKQVMPKGKILLASTNVSFNIEYGVLTFADAEKKDFYSIEATRAADSWIEKEPDTRILTLNSRPLPIPNEVDSWCVAQVSSEE